MYTLFEKLKETVEQFPEAVALQLKDESKYVTYTYKEVYCTAQTIAHSLVGMGIRKSDKVAIILENRPEWGIIYFGILLAGAIAVPIDPQSSREDIHYLLNDSETKIVFTSAKLVSLFHKLTKEVPSLKKIITLDYGKSSKELVAFSDIVAPMTQLKLETGLPLVASEDIASIVYTSGTTGGPKGVMLTHNNFFSNFQSLYSSKLISQKDNILSVLPLHHVFPFMVTLIIPLFYGAKITYISTLKSSELLESMRESGVTILVGVPQLFYIFYTHILNEMKKIKLLIRLLLFSFIATLFLIRKFSGINISKLLLSKIHKSFGEKLRFFVSGGAPLNEDAARFLTKIGFTIIEGYGLTETSPVVALNPLKKQKIGSVGKVISGVEVNIHNPDETCPEHSRRKGVGEIIIKGPNVMKGYYKRDEETGSVLRNGWFYSGDLGYIDNEGYLYITGRIKEIIVLASGKNISPVEVESHYAVSPFIKELCVLGIGKREDENLGAIIVPDLDYIRKVNVSNIYAKIKLELENVSRKLPAYKRITNFIITNEALPRTRLNKIKRFEVKNIYMDKFSGMEIEEPTEQIHETEEDMSILSSGVGKKIVEILTTGLKLKKKISSVDHLELELGIDSLGRVELMANIEKTLNINIPEALMAGIYTVKELILEVEKLVLDKGMHDEKILLSQIKTGSWGEILRRKTPENIISKVNLHYNRMTKLLILGMHIILTIIFKIIWRIKIVGIENLSDEGKFILCPNHTSYLDGFIIATSIPFGFKKDIYFLGQKGYFEGPILKKLTGLIKVIPIDPATNLVEAMQSYAYILSNGKSACIFPEGTRSMDGEIKEFKKGIGILAKELEAPLIPVYISGAYESWPRTKSFPKPHPISIIFGKPCYRDKLIKNGMQLGAEDEYEAIALGIREKVIELKEKIEVTI